MCYNNTIIFCMCHDVTVSNPLHLSTWSNSLGRASFQHYLELGEEALREIFLWKIASMYIFLSLHVLSRAYSLCSRSRMFPKKFDLHLWISVLEILAWIPSWEDCAWPPYSSGSSLLWKTQNNLGPALSQLFDISKPHFLIWSFGHLKKCNLILAYSLANSTIFLILFYFIFVFPQGARRVPTCHLSLFLKNYSLYSFNLVIMFYLLSPSLTLSWKGKTGEM